MTESTEPFVRDVAYAVPRRHDIDIHVSEVEVEGQHYVDVREFIPSLAQYGRGVLIPARLAAEIGSSINLLAKDIEYRKEKPDGK